MGSLHLRHCGWSIVFDSSTFFDFDISYCLLLMAAGMGKDQGRKRWEGQRQ